jgi:hypothetical protein
LFTKIEVCEWLGMVVTSVIPATQEAEIRRTVVPVHLGKNFMILHLNQSGSEASRGQKLMTLSEKQLKQKGLAEWLK